MATQNYSAFHKFMQKFASTRIGGWYVSRTQPYFDRVLLKRTNGRTNLTSMLIGVPIVTLTTVGAKSGLSRTHPLVCIRAEPGADIFAIVGSNWGKKHYPAWYYNLKANPVASCSIQGEVAEYIAHEATGEEYERFWQCAKEVYSGYPSYKQHVGERDIPIMVMTPVT